MDVRFCNGRNHSREAHMRAGSSAASVLRAPQKARVERRVFSLDKRLTWRSATRTKLLCPGSSVRVARHPDGATPISVGKPTSGYLSRSDPLEAKATTAAGEAGYR